MAYLDEVRRAARDATEKAFKESRTDAQRAERLRSRAGHHIGVVPDEHQSADEVGRYLLEKFGQELPANGDFATMAECYLTGLESRRSSAHDARRGGMDSAIDDDSIVGRYIRGEA